MHTHENHMTMASSGQMDKRKRDHKVVRLVWDLCETLFVYILLSTCQYVSTWHWLQTDLILEDLSHEWSQLIESLDASQKTKIVENIIFPGE